MNPLDCSTIIFRAITRSRDVVSGVILAGAFIRRPQDVDGLSIDVLSPQSCVAGFNRHFGVGSLHVGRVRGVERADLDVKVDEHPHGIIEGLPFQDENPAEAERLASLLAEMSRHISRDSIG